jgi:hypothetical protein
MTVNQKEIEKLMAKVANAKNLDLSSGEDLSIGIMNLISIEEHLFFTAQKTGNKKYLDLLNEVRLMRTDLLKEIIQDYEGEVWCISKHLLAASMRLMEVGTKELKKSNKDKAWDLFEKSYKLYNLFWGLNLGNTDKLIRKDTDVNLLDEKGKKSGSVSVFDKLGDIFNKALDCCRE